VHLALTEDISDVRGLKAHIEHARPEMERLEAALEVSRGVFEQLQQRLDEHAGRVGAELDALELAREAQGLRSRVDGLERELDQKDETVRTLRKELDDTRARADEFEIQAGAAFLREGEHEARCSELEETTRRFEAQLTELQSLLVELRAGQETPVWNNEREADYAAQVLELQGRVEDLELAVSRAEAELQSERQKHLDETAERMTRMRMLEQRVDELAEARVELEGRLRTSEIRRLEIETRSQQELTDFADHSLARQREFEARYQAKEREVEALTRRADAFTALQEKMRASSRDLEQRTSQLLELMRRPESAERNVNEEAELPELPELAEPLSLARDDFDSRA